MAKPTSSTAIIPTITDQSSIQALNWGPVTSLFIPPASCTATITDPQGAKPVMFFGHENDPYFDLSCYPTGTMSSLELAKYRDKWAMYYYSPAMCPYGWATVTRFQSIFPGFAFSTSTNFYLGSQTTAALCCPSGFSYKDIGHVCTSVASQDERVQYVRPTSIGVDGWIRGPVSTTTIASDLTVFGDGIPIWWQSSDEAIFASASIAAMASFANATSPTQTQASVPSSTPTTSKISPASDPETSLSGGAKAGIGVGVALGVLGAALASFLFLSLRRKNRAARRMQEIHDTQRLPELGSSGPVEKPAVEVPQEMPVQAEHAELPAYPGALPRNEVDGRSP